MGKAVSQAIDALNEYYGFVGRRDTLVTTQKASDTFAAGGLLALLPPPLGPEPPAEPPTVEREPDPINLRQAMDYILDISEGGMFIKDIIANTDYSAELNSYSGVEKLIKVYYEDLEEELFLQQPLDGNGNVPSITAQTCSSTVTHNSSDGTATVANDVDNVETTSDLPAAGINTVPTDPNKFSTPTLGAILLPSLQSSLATRGTDALALFMNAIPTVQMSMAAPYIDIRIITDRPNIGTLINPGTGPLNDVSLMKFLGVYNVDATSTSDFNYELAAAGPAGIESEDPVSALAVSLPFPAADSTENTTAVPGPNISTAGMELFLSPQTLVNPLINTEERTAAGLPPVIDPMQPLMTLTSLTIQEQLSGKGAVGFTNAKIDIVLHDRSRMSDIGSLLNPQTFSLGSMIIEFGWSHPHAYTADPDNAYAKFINSLRTKEKFQLVRSDFTIQKDGSVSISVHLQAMGGAMIPIVHVCEGKYISSKLVTSLLKRVTAQALRTIDTELKMADILPKQIMSPDKKTSPAALVPRSALIEILQKIKAVSGDQNAEAVQSLATFIGDKIGTDGVSGAESDAESAPSYADELKSKLWGLQSSVTGANDPWLVNVKSSLQTPSYKDDSESEASLAGEPPDDLNALEESASSSFYVSLAKIVMSFIGKPLAASHRFDEVQVLFYGFNVFAGPLADYTTANFPIDYAAFSKMMIKEFEKPQTLTIGKMMRLLSDIVSDAQAEPYGFTKAKPDTSGEDPPNTMEIDTAASETMSKQGNILTTFTTPELKFWVETVPELSTEARSKGTEGVVGTSEVSGKEICKVHVYDAAAHPYFSAKLLLDMIQDKGVVSAYTAARALAAEDPDLTNGETGNLQSAEADLAELEEKEMIEVVDIDSDLAIQTFKQTVPTDTIMAFIRSSVPTIIFGTGFSPISSLEMQSSTSGPIQNAFMERAIMAMEAEIEGEDPAITTNTTPEMLVIPTVIKVTCLGCPILRHQQVMFLDMGTGTTADNIYTVTNIEHVLEAGSFTTSFDMTYIGSAVNSFRSELGSVYQVLNDAASS